MADTPDAIPAFATAARSAILAPMPPLEINATQPWFATPDGTIAEITRRHAVMNLALRSIEADFGLFDIRNSSFDISSGLHPDLRADTATRVCANPKLRSRLADLLRSERQLHANGSMSTNQSGEGDIRRAFIEADLVDCVVALPGKIFEGMENIRVALAA